MVEYAWLAPVLPLVGYVFLLALGRRAAEGLVAGVSVILTFLSFLVSLAVFTALGAHPDVTGTYTMRWLTLGAHSIDVGFQVTHLNALMLVVVSAVSTLVFLFSKGYMHKDERFPVFYQYLNLFVFSMMALVVSPNLLQLYIFWEMVGLCSYLLIGFWYFKPEAALAAKKSFIVTRLGDVGLFIGIILLFLSSGSFDYSTVFQAATTGHLGLSWITPADLTTLTGILVFVGAAGKSAQFPLHVWLPDAMEGPTPVSALIHAATMVAAGVYLVARMYPLFVASGTALTVVAWVGGITALLGALIALTQRDIKRVIAYSTISQLGYMMMGLGVGAYAYGMFHLFTHAFFKALLFLAAGSVIHAVDTQDLFEMGGLGKKMRITQWTFLFGALSLSGVFPWAGFWSKDSIINATLQSGHMTLFWIAEIAAFCTAFYIFRVYFLTFHGKPRDESKMAHAHEGSWVMTVPLIILAVMAFIAGLFNTGLNNFGLQRYLMADSPTGLIGKVYPDNVPLMIISVTVALVGIGLAALMYWKPVISAEKLARNLSGLYRLSFNKFYLDEIYYGVVVWTGKLIAGIVDFFDRYILDLIVRMLGRLGYMGGVGLKYTQTGQVQTYSVIAFFGIMILLAIAMFHVGGVF
ncbi:NADH-quinone oxidoreductase subunit L [Alicyclobacillaceae bacterium I2511]|nr:NADH-quinone oxidoreductase subunit L [Alicyclobacillaceae bacterium I2511]